MNNWVMCGLSPTDLVFAVAFMLLLALGALFLTKAITGAVAEVWFAAKERHTKRIIQLSKEDQ